MNFQETILCPCKVNLRLKVTGKRPDGYHELKSFFLPLPFPCDELTLRETDDAGLAFRCPAFPGTMENLVTKAAKIYAEKSGLTPCWEFRLQKRIPVAAGLGGGSSDAAAALTLLNRRYRAFSAGELAALALSLGADVPFFLAWRPAIARGIGEKLTLLPEDSGYPAVLIVFPGFPVSAKYAYQKLSPARIGEDDPAMEALFHTALQTGDRTLWKRFVQNDLAFALKEKFPLLLMLLDTLLASGAMAAEVSGSGSSCFALFPDGPAAEAAAKDLRTSALATPATRIFTKDKEL